MAEYKILGSWSKDAYLGINNPYAYVIAMSIVDGFYLIISKWLLDYFGKKYKFGIYIENQFEGKEYRKSLFHFKNTYPLHLQKAFERDILVKEF